MNDDEAIAQLQELYDSLPTVECQGHCWNSCGPISMSAVEHRRIEAAGVDIPAYTVERGEAWRRDEPLHCPALKLRRCTVYDLRPLICRVWGTARGQLACPWGCTLNGTRLRHHEVMSLMMKAFRIGGREDADTDYGNDELDPDEADALMSDPEVSALMVRMTNGERHLEYQVQEAMTNALRRLRAT